MLSMNNLELKTNLEFLQILCPKEDYQFESKLIYGITIVINNLFLQMERQIIVSRSVVVNSILKK
jgi:hypothetical protein